MARKKVAASIAADYEYGVTRIRDKSGKVRHSRGNGDAVANALLLHKANGGDVEAVVKANKLTDKMKPHMKKPEGLKRMTLGVMLRAMVRAGEPVKIGKVTVEKLNQKVEMPKVEAKDGARKSAPKKARRATKKAAKPRRARRAADTAKSGEAAQNGALTG